MLIWFRWATLITAFGALAYCIWHKTPWSLVDMTLAAYWVQAFGSIAAILGSFWLVSKQNKAAIQLVANTDLRALKRKGESVAALVEYAIFTMEKINTLLIHVINNDDEDAIETAFKVCRGKIEEAKRVLIAIPAHELGSYSMTVALHQVVGCLSEMLHMIEPQDCSVVLELKVEFLDGILEQLKFAQSGNVSFKSALKALT